MKFKYVQTRVVRYVVIVEAPNVDIADDKMYLHESWVEDGTESEDPPWREDCDQNEPPDLIIREDGTMLTAWDIRVMEKEAAMREHPTKEDK